MFDLKNDGYFMMKNMLSIKDTIIFSMKLFWNIMMLSLIFSAPFIVLITIAHYIK